MVRKKSCLNLRPWIFPMTWTLTVKTRRMVRTQAVKMEKVRVSETPEGPLGTVWQRAPIVLLRARGHGQSTDQAQLAQLQPEKLHIFLCTVCVRERERGRTNPQGLGQQVLSQMPIPVLGFGPAQLAGPVAGGGGWCRSHSLKSHLTTAITRFPFSGCVETLCSPAAQSPSRVIHGVSLWLLGERMVSALDNCMFILNYQVTLTENIGV